MHQRYLLKLLLLPSLLSGTATFIVTVGILTYGGWSYISQNQLFYDTFFGAYGVETLLWDWSSNAPVWELAFLYSPAVYYIFLSGLALIAGLFAYTLIEVARRLLRKSSDALHTPNREMWTRLGVRTAGILGWTMYFSFFISTIAPSILVFLEIGIDTLEDGMSSGLANFAAAFGLLLISIHMHVIFLRLCLLRPRIFGGLAVEEVAIAAEHEE